MFKKLSERRYLIDDNGFSKENYQGVAASEVFFVADYAKRQHKVLTVAGSAYFYRKDNKDQQ